MNPISAFINNIRNLLPYLLLISIYFFFVNVEARREIEEYEKSDNENILHDVKSRFDDIPERIKIPVIPYNN